MDFPVVPDEDFLDSRQACDLLGIAPLRLNKLIQSGSVRIVTNQAGKRALLDRGWSRWGGGGGVVYSHHIVDGMSRDIVEPVMLASISASVKASDVY